MHARAAAIPDVSIVALVVEGQPAIVLEDAVAAEPIGRNEIRQAKPKFNFHVGWC